MPKRSSVAQLPADVKAWLDTALVGSGFSGYEALASSLSEKGFAISKSAIHRYGTDFEATMAAARAVTEQAKALVAACPDDDGAINDALIRMVQQKAFEVLAELQADPAKIKLTALGDMVANLSRSSVTVKKYMADTKKRAAAAAEKVESLVKKSGLTPDAVQAIRREILGIPAAA